MKQAMHNALAATTGLLVASAHLRGRIPMKGAPAPRFGAPPDGYTLPLGNAGPITVNPTLVKKLPYNPQRDLAPVTMVNASRMVLSVHPSLPAKNVAE